MARYKGPRGRICRRLEFPAFESPKFSSLRRSYAPGQHGQSRRRRLSNYCIQLREKQRLKYLYGFAMKWCLPNWFLDQLKVELLGNRKFKTIINAYNTIN